MCSEIFSKYTIQCKLGEGTFSDVLKCKKLSTGQYFAVKKLKKQFKDLSEAKDLPELIVLSKLSDHTNVLTLLEYMFDHKEGKLFMVFELMEMSLYDVIQDHKRRLPENRVKHVLYQLLKGVDHLHSNGIFHRDIKPENILVKKSVVKLADLGSVRGIHSKRPYTEYVSTRWYRAPECILSAGCYGPKMDVWACGCVYYEMLTAKPIFPGVNEIDQLTKIHQVTGTPSTRVIMKMRRDKSRVRDVKFAVFPSINLAVILPFASDGGREVLKRTLVYDPDVRTNVRRLLEHRYFNDLRENDDVIRSLQSSQSNRPTFPLILNNLRLIKGNKSLNNLQTIKLKQKETSKEDRKETVGKLSTRSWGPSTTTANIILSSSKNKVSNRVAQTTTKQKSSQATPTQAIKKHPPDKHEINHIEENKKIKVGSGKVLPAISNKKEATLKNRSQFSFKSIGKVALPPIPEI